MSYEEQHYIAITGTTTFSFNQSLFSEQGVYRRSLKSPRPPADEIVMFMNGCDSDFEKEADAAAKIPTVSRVKEDFRKKKIITIGR